MPAPQLTPELKNDLRLLRMRSALDPARHYKKTHSQATPRYFQVSRAVLLVSRASTILYVEIFDGRKVLGINFVALIFVLCNDYIYRPFTIFCCPTTNAGWSS